MQGYNKRQRVWALPALAMFAPGAHHASQWSMRLLGVSLPSEDDAGSPVAYVSMPPYDQAVASVPKNERAVRRHAEPALVTRMAASEIERSVGCLRSSKGGVFLPSRDCKEWLPWDHPDLAHQRGWLRPLAERWGSGGKDGQRILQDPRMRVQVIDDVHHPALRAFLPQGGAAPTATASDLPLQQSLVADDDIPVDTVLDSYVRHSTIATTGLPGRKHPLDHVVAQQADPARDGSETALMMDLDLPGVPFRRLSVIGAPTNICAYANDSCNDSSPLCRSSTCTCTCRTYSNRLPNLAQHTVALVSDDGRVEVHVLLVTTRDVSRGDELTLDYGPFYFTFSARHRMEQLEAEVMSLPRKVAAEDGPLPRMMQLANAAEGELAVMMQQKKKEKEQGKRAGDDGSTAAATTTVKRACLRRGRAAATTKVYEMSGRGTWDLVDESDVGARWLCGESTTPPPPVRCTDRRGADGGWQGSEVCSSAPLPEGAVLGVYVRGHEEVAGDGTSAKHLYTVALELPSVEAGGARLRMTCENPMLLPSACIGMIDADTYSFGESFRSAVVANPLSRLQTAARGKGAVGLRTLVAVSPSGRATFVVLAVTTRPVEADEVLEVDPDDPRGNNADALRLVLRLQANALSVVMRDAAEFWPMYEMYDRELRPHATALSFRLRLAEWLLANSKRNDGSDDLLRTILARDCAVCRYDEEGDDDESWSAACRSWAAACSAKHGSRGAAFARRLMSRALIINKELDRDVHDLHYWPVERLLMCVPGTS